MRLQYYKVHPENFSSFPSDRDHDCDYNYHIFRYDSIEVQKYIDKIRKDLESVFFTRLIKYKDYQELRLYDNDHYILFCTIKVENSKKITLTAGPQFHMNVKILECDLSENLDDNIFYPIIENFIINCDTAIILEKITVIFLTEYHFFSLNIEIRKKINYKEYYRLFEELTIKDGY